MVQQFRKAGLTQAETAAVSGMSERTVRRIEGEDPIDSPDDNFRKSRRVGRPPITVAIENRVLAWLAEPRRPEDGLIKSVEILARLREEGYTGGRSAVYELVKRVRPRDSGPPLVRFEGLPGEFSQHDHGQRRVVYEDGTVEVVHFFASRLKYSRLIDVRLVPNERLEPFIRAILGAFERFGGVPLMGVFDNLKAAVTDRRTDPQSGRTTVLWNERFGQFCVDVGLIPMACWPYQPQQKGAVENLVGFVKGNFFTGRRFKDRPDLERQLEHWIDMVNTLRPCDATGEVPAVRAERELLRPLAWTAADYPFKESAVVRRNGRVACNGFEYSVPARCRGQNVTLHLKAEKVDIFLGTEHLTTHPRFPENGRYSVHAEHAEEAFVFPRGRTFGMRQILLDTHPVAEPYLTELVHRRPLSWQPEVERLYRLYVETGHGRFVQALQTAWTERAIGAEYLAHLAGSGVSHE